MDRQYRLALLIILIPLITLAASTLTYYFGYKPSEINANGTPIEPKIQTQNLNLKLVTSNLMPLKYKPSKILINFSYVGLVFLTLFALAFVKLII